MVEEEPRAVPVQNRARVEVHVDARLTRGDTRVHEPFARLGKTLVQRQSLIAASLASEVVTCFSFSAL